MSNSTEYDIIIAGGSYAGLAAAMALGRAMRRVLVIDSGNPCNKQTPYSHNFPTNDGKRPWRNQTTHSPNLSIRSNTRNHRAY